MPTLSNEVSKANILMTSEDEVINSVPAMNVTEVAKHACVMAHHICLVGSRLICGA